MSLDALSEDLLAHVLEFANARDVEAMTVASATTARFVIPRHPQIWRGIFCRQWEALNFALPGSCDGVATVTIDPRVDELFDR